MTKEESIRNLMQIRRCDSGQMFAVCFSWRGLFCRNSKGEATAEKLKWWNWSDKKLKK